jgi:amino acid adenylation domain-containing protein
MSVEHRPSFVVSSERQALMDVLLDAEGLTGPADRIVVRTDRSPCPLSFAQQRLWFLDRMVPGNAFYNLNHAVRLTFPLNAGVLRRCLEEMAARHEILRTTFSETAAGPVQVVAPRLDVPVPVVDLGDLEPAARDAEVGRLATLEARQPFDLARGPLLRAKALRLAPDQWVLLVTVHHIAADGWSMRLFFEELRALYDCFAAGRPSPLDPLPIQYADFALWQRTWLSKEVLDRQLGYWRRQLADLPTLELPSDRSRPRVQSFAGKSHAFTLAPELTSGLRALSQREGATLFMTLLTGWKSLLARYSGQHDLVVGVPIAGRTRTELEPLIGFFVNTLVLRTDLAGDPSFTEALRRVRAVALGAYAHQDVPFEKLVEELQPERDLSRNPLCQVAFQLFSASRPRASRGARASDSAVLDVERGTANFDLGFTLAEDGDRLVGRIEYNTDLYEPATIERLAKHYRNILADAVADPSRPLSQLEPMSAAERQQVLFGFNDTAADYPDVPLAQLFEAQVERTPAALAIKSEDGELSYRALNARANQLAHHLRGLGVGPGVVVGLALPRSLDLVVSLLATLKAGGVYLPLDPGYPPERLGFMVAEADVTVLLTRSELIDTCPPAPDASLLCLDQLVPVLAARPVVDPPASAGPDDLAYIIFTSGSTGRPKGAMNTQRGICNRLHWMQEAFPLDGSDRVLHKTPIGFDVSVWELIWPLLAGATMIVAAPGEQGDPRYLVDLMARERVTTVHFVPSLLDRWLEAPGLETVQHLRRVICSGEALTPTLVTRFFQRVRGELHNLYGPTEAAIDVTAWRCSPASEGGGPVGGSVPIGRPIKNLRMYVLDERRRPLPIGVPGELYIGGVGLARGYVGRPDLTAERFVPDPFADNPEARLYRTGDRGRWRLDGAIEFLGRLDHQVKIRGVRIELGEIEAALAAQPQVREVVVVPADDPGGGQCLVAYLVPAGGGMSPRELRAALATRLPEQMIPSVFVEMAALPHTPSGKVDRRALPAPDREGGARDRELVPPRSALERDLTRIWAEVLGITRVGVDDNFFELGGHSLLATQVVARLRSVLDVDLPLRSFFEAPTVAELARTVASLAGVARPRGEAIPRLTPADPPDLLDGLDQMSDEQVEQSLQRLLAEDQSQEEISHE